MENEKLEIDMEALVKELKNDIELQLVAKFIGADPFQKKLLFALLRPLLDKDIDIEVAMKIVEEQINGLGEIIYGK